MERRQYKENLNVLPQQEMQERFQLFLGLRVEYDKRVRSRLQSESEDLTADFRSSLLRDTPRVHQGTIRKEHWLIPWHLGRLSA